MNKEAQELLQIILAKHPESLYPEEQAFLRARRYALTPEQRERFALALGDVANDQGIVHDKKKPQAPILDALSIDRLNPKPIIADVGAQDEEGGDPYDPDYRPKQQSQSKVKNNQNIIS